MATLAEYERHLGAERDLTQHTIRAYVGDIAGLLDHAARLGHHDVGGLDLRTLRSWLAKQQTTGPLAYDAGPPGHCGAGLHRMAGTHREVGAGCRRTARLPATAQDAAAGAARRRGGRSVRSAAEAADDGSPVGVRDVAMLELLYARASG